MAQRSFPIHLAALMDDAFTQFRRDLLTQVGDVGPLRPSHLRILDSVDEQGTRPSTLAERTAITRQGISQLIGHLEEHGYVESVRDPTDRRATMITPTPRGLAAVERTREAIGEVERVWADRLGADRYEVFRTCLEELGAASEAPAR